MSWFEKERQASLNILFLEYPTMRFIKEILGNKNKNLLEEFLLSIIKKHFSKAPYEVSYLEFKCFII